MSLNEWAQKGKLKAHKTSAKEIVQLLTVVERDLTDAQVLALSADRRFTTAYNGALQLATILLRLAGFRTNSNQAGHHQITIEALPKIMGPKLKGLADYLNTCRTTRHLCDYTSAGEVSEEDIAKCLEKIHAFRKLVLQQVKQAYPRIALKA